MMLVMFIIAEKLIAKVHFAVHSLDVEIDDTEFKTLLWVLELYLHWLEAFIFYQIHENDIGRLFEGDFNGREGL